MIWLVYLILFEINHLACKGVFPGLYAVPLLSAGSVLLGELTMIQDNNPEVITDGVAPSSESYYEQRGKISTLRGFFPFAEQKSRTGTFYVAVRLTI
jgi:hypothetical protein